MIHNNVKITTDISTPAAGFVELERETGGYICRSDSRKLWTVLNWSRIITLTTERYSLFSPETHHARRSVQDGLLCSLTKV